MIEKVAVVAAAVGGLALASAGVAAADQEVRGVAGSSSGVASGNSMQVPVHVPVNVCGNTVSVLGYLNTAGGSACPVN